MGSYTKAGIDPKCAQENIYVPFFVYIPWEGTTYSLRLRSESGTIRWLSGVEANLQIQKKRIRKKSPGGFNYRINRV